MKWDELGIAAAVGALLLKLTESLSSYISQKYFPTKRDNIETERGALDLYKELLDKFREVQTELFQSKEQWYQKQKELEDKISHLQIEFRMKEKAEKDCLETAMKLESRIKQYEEVVFKIITQLSSHKNEINEIKEDVLAINNGNGNGNH